MCPCSCSGRVRVCVHCIHPCVALTISARVVCGHRAARANIRRPTAAIEGRAPDIVAWRLPPFSGRSYCCSDRCAHADLVSLPSGRHPPPRYDGTATSHCPCQGPCIVTRWPSCKARLALSECSSGPNHVLGVASNGRHVHAVRPLRSHDKIRACCPSQAPCS